MKNYIIFCLLTFTILGCELPQVIRPLRLYNLEDGKTIEVFLRNNSLHGGKLVSAREGDENFEGEIALYGGSTGNYRPPLGTTEFGKASAAAEKLPDNASLAKLYGFGKDTDARPVGTAILIGSKGTAIEIVLYGISADRQYGDGVARDNKGRYYRVFLSVEE